MPPADPPPAAGGAPFRLLHVYSGNLYGGVERLLETLHACGSEQDGGDGAGGGLRQDFALCFRGRLSERLRAAGARVTELGRVRRVEPWTALWARRRLAAALRSAAAAGEPYDAVLFHSFWSLALLGTGLRADSGEGRGSAIPRLLWVHDDPNPSHWTFRGAVRAGADGAIFNSEFVRGRPASRALLKGLTISEDRVAVVRPPAPAPPPAAAERRAALRAELGAEPDDVLILTAARFEACKGHELLLDALGRLANERRWICAFAGDAQRPAERARVAALRTRAERLNVGNRLRWLGHRDDVPDLMAAADLYCQPNVSPEAFGLTFVEALYAGCPVVTTAIGGGREILRAGLPEPGLPEPGLPALHGPAGRLTGIDPAAVAEALRSLIVDPARRRRLAAAGPARAAALCDPQARLAELEAFCRRTAGRPAVAPLRPAATRRPTPAAP
ncbi:glycosyltransferase [Alienimonas californiensis]|uniref:Mannosylfructose-phosphate synthase n=1 Tax=Alienimonas californiensis TaxID=2527989 RepID=A0A517P7X0_9PLAN|nr:glycosyltransferase [Alienimonas californiensis]QDT15480.1 Mannosylfructose-phosphate synthase [Alienimonas californiensis]